MSALENEIIRPALENGLISDFHRWVDDTVVRIRRKDIPTLHEAMNSFHPKLKFTIENPSEVLVDGVEYKFLPFLDIGLYWRENEFVTRVYRKPTASRIVMPFHEFAPFSWKNGTLIFFIRRAITHCSTYHAMHTELDTVTKQFRNCGYPAHFVADKINQTMTKMLYPETNPESTNTQETPNRFTVLHLPWCGDDAFKTANFMRKQIPAEHSRVSISTTATKLRDILPKLDTCTIDARKPLIRNCVYKYTCACGKVYIGETKRRLAVRIAEHAKNGAIRDHVNESVDCVFDPGVFTVIASNLKGTNARKRCEALYIRWYDRKAQTVNNQTYSRELVIW